MTEQNHDARNGGDFSKALNTGVGNHSGFELTSVARGLSGRPSHGPVIVTPGERSMSHFGGWVPEPCLPFFLRNREPDYK